MDDEYIEKFMIPINHDIESRRFKENFFYHFDVKETVSLFVALLMGGITYLLASSFGLNENVVTVCMALACALPLLIGFFKKQGYGFLEYVRQIILLRLCPEMEWESTEEFEKNKIVELRRGGSFINEPEEKDK